MSFDPTHNQVALEEHHHLGKVKCNRPHSLYCKDRKTLAIEGSLHTPIFPEVNSPCFQSIQLAYSQKVKGDHFQVYPRVVDTNFIKDPRILSSIDLFCHPTPRWAKVFWQFFYCSRWTKARDYLNKGFSSLFFGLCTFLAYVFLLNVPSFFLHLEHPKNGGERKVRPIIATCKRRLNFGGEKEKWDQEVHLL